MDKLRIPGLTGVDLSTSDADTPPNKLLHSENFILSQKYGNLRKRAGSVEYAITGDVYGIAGYAKSNVSFLSPISVIPVRYRVASATPYFEQLDWDQEGTIRNLLLRSEEFDNAAWPKLGATVTADTAVAIDGTTSADTIFETTATSVHYISQGSVAVISGTQYRFMLDVLKKDKQYFQMTMSGGFATWWVNADLDAGTISYSSGGDSVSIEGLGGGWYRLVVLATATSTTNTTVVYSNIDTSTAARLPTYLGSASLGTYIARAQINLASDLATYTATTATAVYTPAWAPITINADVSSLLQTSGVVRMPQVDSTMAVFAGTPAMITDIDIGELQRLGGPAPTVAPTIAASAGAGALTGDFYCAYTFYDSTSGWESSLSPFSTLLTIAAKDIEWSALPTTYSKSGVDSLRLYRTESSGEQVFYRVTTMLLGSSTYTDSVTLLGSISDDIGAHDPPPTGAYLGEDYANRFWTTDGNNGLHFSKAFDGDANNLQYWPDTNVIFFEQKITALRKSERLGGLLVFKPPGYGIDLIRGSSEDTFELVPLYSELGTNYDSSVTVYGDDVVFWGDGRPILIRNGNVIAYYSKPLEDKLNQLALNDYNAGSFVWSFYHSQFQQVFWGVSALSDSGSAWEELGSGLFAAWEVKDDGTPAGWT